MKYQQLIESRKNPSMSTRSDICSELIELETHNSGNMYVSFTEIKKLGINPDNQFHTPTGIYSYPLSYVVDIINDSGSTDNLPFASNRPYAWVLTVQGVKLDVVNYNRSTAEIDIKKLDGFVKKHRLKYFVGLVDTCADLFNQVNAVAKSYIDETKQTSHLQHTISSMMVHVLGYDYCEDLGSGTIHPDEPYQCVVYNPKAIVKKELLFTKSKSTDVVQINVTSNRTIGISIGTVSKVKEIRIPNGVVKIQASSYGADDEFNGYTQFENNSIHTEVQFTFGIDVPSPVIKDVNANIECINSNTGEMKTQTMQLSNVNSIIDLVSEFKNKTSSLFKPIPNQTETSNVSSLTSEINN